MFYAALKNAAMVLAFIGTSLFSPLFAQYPGWQQRADYMMQVHLDTAQHGISGTTQITFTNASPDSLDRLHFHLFFNAFQPGSMMDVRSRNIVDPDPRVGSRIAELPEDEWGRMEVTNFGISYLEEEVIGSGIKPPLPPYELEHDGTLLTVRLPMTIAPGERVFVNLEWEGIVPRQIRRSGWMNKEGVEYSMAQWFPKLCEYDHWGWHTDPYIGREFHGIFGNYDVRIQAPVGYLLGGTGTQVAETPEVTGKWRFIADNVLDFVWAADPDYVVESIDVDGVTLQCYHQSSPALDSTWAQLPEYAARAMRFFNELVGPYPYPQYSIIQGGDGGMEYPMATLITGERSLRSLVGVTVHEMAHSWFQAVLASNESLYEFMDEGMTSYISSLCMQHLFEGPDSNAPHRYAYAGYMRHALSGNEEPLSTHADHYSTNRGYGVAAYSKGEVLVAQLQAVIGPDAVAAGLRDYYNRFSFKHPGPIDLMRCMERASGIELDWYVQYFVYTTHTVDYGIERVERTEKGSSIHLRKIGGMPMPTQVEVVFEDGDRRRYMIPLHMMRGDWVPEAATLLPDWPWVDPLYVMEIDDPRTLSEVHLDPEGWVADVDDNNDHYPFTAVEGTEVPEAKGKNRKRNKN